MFTYADPQEIANVDEQIAMATFRVRAFWAIAGTSGLVAAVAAAYPPHLNPFSVVGGLSAAFFGALATMEQNRLTDLNTFRNNSANFTPRRGEERKGPPQNRTGWSKFKPAGHSVMTSISVSRAYCLCPNATEAAFGTPSAPASWSTGPTEWEFDSDSFLAGP